MRQSNILQTAMRYLLPLLVLYSVFLLFQGHHEPGGGFVGGLVAASAVALCALAFDAPTARYVLPLPPQRLLGLGLLCIGGSGVIGILRGDPFLTGVWISLRLPAGSVKLGSPLLFDVGVYLVVVGVVIMVVLTLAED